MHVNLRGVTAVARERNLGARRLHAGATDVDEADHTDERRKQSC